MPRKNTLDKKKRGLRNNEYRAPRTRPRVHYSMDLLDYKNVEFLKQFVTDQGRILPRKYTGLPAPYQRKLTRAVKRARHALLMK